MVADSDLTYFRGYSRQRGVGFGALAQTIGRTAIPFLRRDVIPAAKRIGADLIELAAPEIGNVLAGRKKFKSAATDVGKKTLRKQLAGGKPRKRRIIRKRSPKISRFCRTRRDIFLKLKWIPDQQMIVISVMDTLQILARRFLTFRFWNQLNPRMFKKFIPVLHWMKAALNLNLN